MLLRIFLFTLFLLISCTTGVAENINDIIAQLDLKISQANDSLTKSNLHIFRARNFNRMNKQNAALEDYNLALELNHQGWIHLERCSLLMGMGEYELALEDAKAAKQEVPTLAREADRYIARAETELQKRYEKKNPLTIVMDTEVDPYRKSRFDVMEEQGVFAARAMKKASINQQKKVARLQRKTASTSSKSKRPKS